MPATGPGDRGLLRILTCGSVDDGKSTLIGRLLYESGAVADDALAALRADSRRHGTVGGELDYALLLDGLEAERQQGITIDVAYRYFGTARRTFIVADCPGHEQYTRNMITGASHSELAILLVDARKGLLRQTRRHAYLCALVGIRDLILAVNKIDLVDYDEVRFDRIVGEFQDFAEPLSFRSIRPIPIAARSGDNLATRSTRTPWYGGPPLLPYLETLNADEVGTPLPFRFPVQWLSRPDQDFRGYAGTVVAGAIRAGDPVTSALTGRTSTVARIVTADGDLSEARAGDAVTLTLAEELDIGRGDVLASPNALPSVTDQFAAHLVWLDDSPLLPGRQYVLRTGHHWTSASVTQIKHKVEVETFEHAAARTLGSNEIGFCNLATLDRVAVDPYGASRDTGAFILVDAHTNRTCGAGMIEFSLRRASNIRHEDYLIDKAFRARQNAQTPLVIWFTGLSGSGKSTVAKLVEQALAIAGKRTYTLDGDNLRHGLNRDLGFTDADRVENIRRVGEVARLMVDAGLIVICSFISPFRAEREMVRAMFGSGEFMECFVDTPLADCMRRDPKGLYEKAQRGVIRNFTGLDSPYEPPEAPDLVVRTIDRTPAESALTVLDHLRRLTLIP